MDDEKLSETLTDGKADNLQPQPAQPESGAAPAATASEAAGTPPPPTPEPPPAPEMPPMPETPPPPEEPKPESKARRFFRRLVRWTLGVLIVFGIGFVAATWLLYKPARNAAAEAQAAATKAAQQAQDAQGQLLSAQSQIKSLQQKLDEVQGQVSGAQMTAALATAKAEVYATRLALKDGDETGARLHAEALANALAALKDVVPSEHQDVVTDMQAQVAEAQAKLDSPNYADRQLRAVEQHLLALEDLLSK